jgi:hypothetical protein
VLSYVLLNFAQFSVQIHCSPYTFKLEFSSIVLLRPTFIFKNCSGVTTQITNGLKINALVSVVAEDVRYIL